jgi:hypothetical protein
MLSRVVFAAEAEQQRSSGLRTTGDPVYYDGDVHDPKTNPRSLKGYSRNKAAHAPYTRAVAHAIDTHIFANIS